MKFFTSLLGFIAFCVQLTAQTTTVDFTSCPAGSTATCSIYSPQCSNTLLSTNYGAPVFYNYTYTDYNGSTATSKLIRLEGNMIANPNDANLSIPVDCGFNVPYLFNTNTHYTIEIFASGVRENNSSKQFADMEVLVTGPPVNQVNPNGGCSLGVFDAVHNPGITAISATPSSYSPTRFSATVLIPSSGYSNIIVRSKSTSQLVGQPNSLLVYQMYITQSTGLGDPNNICYNTDININYDVVTDFNNINRYPPTGQSVFAWSGDVTAWHTITASGNTTISHGRYIYVANQTITFNPGYSTTLLTGGSMIAVIGKCTDLSPLSVLPPPTDSLPRVQPTQIVLGETNDLKMYPNPSSGLIEVTGSDIYLKDADLTVVDQLGRKVFQMHNATNDKLVLNLAHLNNGLYFLQVRNNGKTTVNKFVINH